MREVNVLTRFDIQHIESKAREEYYNKCIKNTYKEVSKRNKFFGRKK